MQIPAQDMMPCPCLEAHALVLTIGFVRPAVSLEKTSVNKMVVVAGAVAAIAGGYYGVNFYKSRQAALVDEFAMSMMLYWGDAVASK